MNEDELASLDANLRELVSSLGLDWLLDEVDRSIAEGHAEEKVVRRRLSNQRASYAEDLWFVDSDAANAEKRSSRDKPIIVVRPMTFAEQVRQLIVALKVVLVETPLVERAIFENLTAGDDGDSSVTISFVEENPRGFGEPRTTVIRPDTVPPVTIAELRARLDRLLEEVDA